MPIAEAFELVTTVDSEWDDEQRERMLALTLHERELCACGWPRRLCRDPETHFRIVEDEPCQIEAGLARYSRLAQHNDQMTHKHADLDNKPGAPHPGDGRRAHVELAAPQSAT